MKTTLTISQRNAIIASVCKDTNNVSIYDLHRLYIKPDGSEKTKLYNTMLKQIIKRIGRTKNEYYKCS